MKTEKKYFLLSLGGSLIVPNGGIDTKFLKRFESYIRKKVAQDCHFFIVTGGGAIARQYADAGAKADPQITDFDLDWLMIHATRLNAQLMRTLFRDICYQRVIKHYEIIDKNALDYKVVIAAGWKPGWSTDYDAVLLAQDYDIPMVINMSDIKAVMDKDPDKYKNAKPIKKMSWDELLKITGTEWKSGLNSPFDPVAAKLAQKIGIKVIVCDGRNLKNLDNIIEGSKFEGTVIE